MACAKDGNLKNYVADYIFQRTSTTLSPIPHLHIFFFYSVTMILFPLKRPMFSPFESGQVYDYNESDHFVNSKTKP